MKWELAYFKFTLKPSNSSQFLSTLHSVYFYQTDKPKPHIGSCLAYLKASMFPHHNDSLPLSKDSLDFSVWHSRPYFVLSSQYKLYVHINLF